MHLPVLAVLLQHVPHGSRRRVVHDVRFIVVQLAVRHGLLAVRDVDALQQLQRHVLLVR